MGGRVHGVRYRVAYLQLVDARALRALRAAVALQNFVARQVGVAPWARAKELFLFFGRCSIGVLVGVPIPTVVAKTRRLGVEAAALLPFEREPGIGRFGCAQPADFGARASANAASHLCGQCLFSRLEKCVVAFEERLAGFDGHLRRRRGRGPNTNRRRWRRGWRARRLEKQLVVRSPLEQLGELPILPHFLSNSLELCKLALQHRVERVVLAHEQRVLAVCVNRLDYRIWVQANRVVHAHAQLLDERPSGREHLVE